MKAITKKLKSRRGASLLIALLFFLMAAMVGTVVLASSTANVDRIHQREEKRQEYLALNSAVRLLRETLEGVEGTAWERITKYQCRNTGLYTVISGAGYDPIHTEDKKEVADKLTLSGSEDGDGGLQKLVADMAFGVFRSKTEIVERKPLPTTPVTFAVEGEDMPIVDVSMLMDSNYDLTVKLQVRNSSETVTMTFFGEDGITPSEPTNFVRACHHLTRVTVIVDNLPESRDVPQTIDNKTEIKTLTVKWNSVVVRKGA